MTHLRRPWESVPTRQLVSEMRSFLRDESDSGSGPFRPTPSSHGTLEYLSAEDDSVVDTLLAQCVARARERSLGYVSRMRVAQWLGERGDIEEAADFFSKVVSDPKISELDRNWVQLYHAYWQTWTRGAGAARERIEALLTNTSSTMRASVHIAAITYALVHGDYVRLREMWEVDERILSDGLSGEDLYHLRLLCIRARAYSGDAVKARIEVMRLIEQLESSGSSESLILSARSAGARADITAGFSAVALESVTASLERARKRFDGAHPIVVDLAGVAVEALCATQQVARARETAAQMFVSLVSTRGPDHPLTLAARWLIARSAASANAIGIVLKETEICMSATERRFGATHRQTLRALLYASWITSQVNSTSTARKYLSKFAERYGSRASTAADPDHLWFRMMEAYLCLCEGGPVDALSTLPGIIADGRHAFGQYNHIVLDARRHLAKAMIASGATSEGNRQLANLEAEILSIFGPSHYTLTALRFDLGTLQDRRRIIGQ